MLSPLFVFFPEKKPKQSVARNLNPFILLTADLFLNAMSKTKRLKGFLLAPRLFFVAKLKKQKVIEKTFPRQFWFQSFRFPNLF